MEFRHLRYFVAVAERRNISQAAQQLRIAQPPLSRQIRQLEDEIGAPLLVRNKRGVELTAAGQVFLKQAKKLIANCELAAKKARSAQARQAAIVKIGIASGLGGVASQVMATHRLQFPSVEIQCRDIFSTPQNDALRARDIDVGFLRPPIDSAHLDSQVLFEEEFYVVLPRRHPLSKHRRLRLRDVISEPLIIFDRRYSSGLYDKILELYHRQGLTPRLTVTHTETHEEAGKVMVASGRGIFIGVGAMVNTSVFGVQLSAIRLHEPGATVQICIAWRKQEASSAVLAFVDSARNTFRDAVSPWSKTSGRSSTQLHLGHS